jgi:hypothetical protein
LITWMAWCELWVRRKLNGKKTCSSGWGLLERCCPHTMLKWLQRWACFHFCTYPRSFPEVAIM